MHYFLLLSLLSEHTMYLYIVCVRKLLPVLSCYVIVPLLALTSPQIRNIVEASNGQKMTAQRKWDRVRKYMKDWKLSREVGTCVMVVHWPHMHAVHFVPCTHNRYMYVKEYGQY